jgi:hypothetical protein
MFIGYTSPMSTTNPVKNEIEGIKAEYDRLSKGNKSLLHMSDGSEFRELP